MTSLEYEEVLHSFGLPSQNNININKFNISYDGHFVRINSSYNDIINKYLNINKHNNILYTSNRYDLVYILSFILRDNRLDDVIYNSNNLILDRISNNVNNSYNLYSDSPLRDNLIKLDISINNNYKYNDNVKVYGHINNDYNEVVYIDKKNNILKSSNSNDSFSYSIDYLIDNTNYLYVDHFYNEGEYLYILYYDNNKNNYTVRYDISHGIIKYNNYEEREVSIKDINYLKDELSYFVDVTDYIKNDHKKIKQKALFEE